MKDLSQPHLVQSQSNGMYSKKSTQWNRSMSIFTKEYLLNNQSTNLQITVITEMFKLSKNMMLCLSLMNLIHHTLEASSLSSFWLSSSVLHHALSGSTLWCFWREIRRRNQLMQVTKNFQDMTPPEPIKNKIKKIQSQKSLIREMMHDQLSLISIFYQFLIAFVHNHRFFIIWHNFFILFHNLI